MESVQEESNFKVINVGSRESQLALIQTNLVIERLKEFYLNNPDHLKHFEQTKQQKLEFQVKSMKTNGDKVLDKPLPSIGAKSLFTKELEDVLLQGKVDFVVHSLKDLPTTLPEGCVIGAIMKRHDPNDVIVLRKSLRDQITNPIDLLLKQNLTETAGGKLKIGTSSQRRIAMVKRCNPNLDCIDIRGNLNTRIAKLDKDEGEYAAIILAKAGLDRLGWTDRALCLLTPEANANLSDWYYAVGQGAIAVECRANDEFILSLLRPIVDLKTTYEVIAERSLMKRLDGGCTVPLGVRSKWTRESKEVNELELKAIVLSIDGETIIKSEGDTCLRMEDSTESVKDCLELQTTGVQFPSCERLPVVMNNMIDCFKLGVDVANKMIDLGCLELIRRR